MLNSFQQSFLSGLDLSFEWIPEQEKMTQMISLNKLDGGASSEQSRFQD